MIGLIRSLAFACCIPWLTAFPQDSLVGGRRPPADEFIISGDALRRSGANSLGEALIGKVPGMTAHTSSGAFGALPALYLRGISSHVGLLNPLLVVDGVPITLSRVEDGVPANGPPTWRRLSDFPLVDIERVRIIRDASAAMRYGSRAIAGAILIETRRPAPGFGISASQRTGVATLGEHLELARVSRTEAQALPYGRVRAPDALAASWDSCGGYCDPEALYFGGTRLLAESRLRAEGGVGRATGSVSVQSRHAGLPLRGTSGDYRSGRVQVGVPLGLRGQVTLSHMLGRTTSDNPLETNRNDYPALWATWINPRGVSGFFADTQITSIPIPFLPEARRRRQETTQYLSAGVLTFHLLRRGSGALEFSARGGLHRQTQRDAFEPPTLPGLRASGDAREVSSGASLRFTSTGTRQTVALATGYDYERLEERGAWAGAPALFTTREWLQRGVWGSAHLSVDDRLLAAVQVRRDAARPYGFSVDPLSSWMGSLGYRVVDGASTRVTLRGALAQARAVVPLNSVFPSFESNRWREHRDEAQFGLNLSLAGGRGTLDVTAFQSTSRDDEGPPSATVVGQQQLARFGTLRNRGAELSASVAVTGSWRTTLTGGHARARLLDTPVFFPLGLGGPPGTIVIGLPGGSPTAIRIASGDTTVGDAQTRVTLAHLNELTWRGWRLTTQVDAEIGGERLNSVQYSRDLVRVAPLPDLGQARLAAARSAQPVYVQGATWWSLREIVLSHRVPGRWFPPGTRLEVSGRNLLLQSDLEAYDPSARRFGAYQQRAVVDNPFPRLRSFSLAVVLGAG